MAKNLLVFGATGQLAREITKLGNTDALLITSVGRDQADLSQPASLPAVIDQHRPDGVINAAAYTAVDKAEEEEPLATTINGEAPGVMAQYCRRLGIPMLHVSTDYVFDGTKTGAYTEDDPIAPLGAYGRSKAQGEQAIRDAIAEHLIIRTAWVYSPHGHNFVKTMLRVGAERDQLRVVADQHGSPTSAADLAAACVGAIGRVLTHDRDVWGTYHYTGQGAVSWHGFADAIFDIAKTVWHRRPTVDAITTAEYPTPAARPANSELSCHKIADQLGITAKPWRDSLEPVVRTLLTE